MRRTARFASRNSDILECQKQLTQAFNTPALVQYGMRDCDELLPRFAAYYTYLKALPRRVRKALQRHWHLPLSGVALMLALGHTPALAATMLVGANCTLVNAITAANTDSATGGCPAGSGADTIILPPGSTQTLTQVNNSTYGPTGLPVIISVITIEGQGTTIGRDSESPNFRLLAVTSSGELVLRDTTVTGGAAVDDTSIRAGGAVLNYSGTVTLYNSTISSSSAYHGGGIASYLGRVTIVDSTITDNSAGLLGGGILTTGLCTVTGSTISGNSATRYGGGVFNDGSLSLLNSTITGNSVGITGGGVNSPGNLTVMDSIIADNFARFGGGGILNGLTSTVLNSAIVGNSSDQGGGGVSNRYGPLMVLNSTIVGNSATGGGGVVNYGTLTITNSTIVGNSAFAGAGLANTFYGTLTVLNSTISDNLAYYSGGGLENRAGNLVVVNNSTITGNSANDGGGMANLSGSLVLLNSTIARNTATGSSAGGVSNGAGTLMLVRTIVTGNAGLTAQEIFNDIGGYGNTIIADNNNLFGLNGNAGVVGFTPGPTDIVPVAGVQLSNILNPTLAFNGGPTQTHALVPGSPAIDAGGPVCTDANGNPLLTDQRGKPRIIDGNGDGTARCDIGAFEFFPVVNNLVTLDPALDTSFNPTPVPNAPAGTFTITATFTNTSSTALRFPFFTVTELSGDNVLLNAEEGPRGVGATVTPNVGDQVLASGETVNVDFVIGLQTPTPFTFFVDLFAEPLVSGASTSRHRPTVTKKGGRR